MPLKSSALICSAAFLFAGCLPENSQEPSPTAYQKVTGEDFEDVKSQWDHFYTSKNSSATDQPSDLIREHLETLPKGKVLDIAMGEGQNSIFLAKKGFITEGVDISEVALRKAKLIAKQNQVTITTHAMPMEDFYIRPESYDVILDIRFVRKPLINPIKRGLRKGGVIVFEVANSKTEPERNRMTSAEIRELFKDFQILVFRELDQDSQSVTQLVARKPI